MDHRIEPALAQLVEAILPGLPYETEEEIEARQDDAVENAQAILERWVSSPRYSCFMS